MKLTLEPDHPLAKAIRDATADFGAGGVLVLALDRLDGHDGTHTRPLSMRVTSWFIEGKSGRHSKDSDLTFHCEFVDLDAHREYLRSLHLPVRVNHA